MPFYILPIISLLCLFKPVKKNIRLIVILLLFFLAVRGVGTDYISVKSYFQGFDLYSPYLFDRVIVSKINKIPIGYFYRYQLYITLVSIITIFFYWLSIKKILKKKQMIVESLILFLLSYSYFANYNVFRQGMAIAIFLFSLKYIYERKLIKYIMCIFLGAIFHTSILALVPMYFILSKKISFKYILGIIFLVIILGEFGILKIITAKIPFFGERYEESKIFFTGKQNIYRIIFELIITGFFIIPIDLKKIKSTKERIFYNIFFIKLIVFIMTSYIVIFSRFLLYFDNCIILSYPILYEKIKNKKIWIGILICYYFVMYIRFIKVGSHQVFPYKFF